MQSGSPPRRLQSVSGRPGNERRSTTVDRGAPVRVVGLPAVGNLRAGAESAQAVSQELAEQIQQRGPEEVGKVLDQETTEEADETLRSSLRRIIRESVERSRGKA